MNLFQRRVEMPGIVCRDKSLTCDEKVLLAIVYSLDRGDGIALTWRDVAETLQLPKPVAINILRTLSAQGALVTTKKRGHRPRVKLGGRIAEAIKHERVAPQVRLTLSYIQCLCGYDLKMDHVDLVRVCPKCRRVVCFSDAEKKYFSRWG